MEDKKHTLEELELILNPKVGELSELAIEKAKFKFFAGQLIDDLFDGYQDGDKSHQTIKRVLDNNVFVDIDDDDDRDDSEVFIEYYLKNNNWDYIVKGLSQPHYGDCTACSCPCVRCHSEKFFGLNTVSWGGKHKGSGLVHRYFDLIKKTQGKSVTK